MSEYAICPRCKMEAIRLVKDGKCCDWCVDGKAMTEKKWGQHMRGIKMKMALDQATAVALALKSSRGLSDKEYERVLKEMIRDAKKNL